MENEQNFDPGSGTRYFRETKRIINPDGSFNVTRKGRKISPKDAYHYLINIRWGKFILLITIFYILLNFLFGAVYALLGIEGLTGHPSQGFFLDTLNGFFFSAQTFTTVGYGGMSPEGIPLNLVASLEAMFGLLSFALCTGLLWGRFSKPTSRILFSQKAIIAPLKEFNSFQCRIVNERNNQMMDLEAKMLYATLHKDGDGYRRRYSFLPLEVSKISLFPLTWTLVHEINQDSPLYGKSREDLECMKAEIMVLVKGFDDTFSQTVHVRNSYISPEIVWGAKFERSFHTDSTGEVIMDVYSVHDYKEASLHPWEMPAGGMQRSEESGMLGKTAG